MRILLTNDDGINARGIQALRESLLPHAQIYMVAPDQQRSGTGHSITVFDPIRVKKMVFPGVEQAWHVQGTPADAVKLALSRLIEDKPDLIISGINHGSNLGTDILYSGTVSAAAEGVIMGIPAIAISLDSFALDADFSLAARFAVQMVKLIENEGIEKSTLLNINVPAVPAAEIKGIRVCKMGVRIYNNVFEPRTDPRGNTYFWLGGGRVDNLSGEDTDVFLAKHNYITITPIHLDLTNYGLIKRYQDLLSKGPLLLE